MELKIQILNEGEGPRLSSELNFTTIALKNREIRLSGVHQRNAAQGEAVETQSMRRNVGSLQEERRVPASQPEEKQGPQSCKHKELNFTNSRNELGSRFFPRASRKEHSPVDSLILAPQDLCHTSDLQNCEVINLGYFRPLSLW